MYEKNQNKKDHCSWFVTKIKIAARLKTQDFCD